MDMLIAVRGAHQGQRYPLSERRLVLGRDRRADIRLADEGVSRRHAAIFPRDGKIWLEDLGSTNGTYLNHVRLSAPTEVAHNDRIALGETVLLLQIDRPSHQSGIIVSDKPHESNSVIKVDLNSTSIFEVLGKEDSTVVGMASVPETLITLHGFSNSISGILDPNDLLECALPLMIRNCHAERGAVLLLNDGGVLEAKAHVGRDGEAEVIVSRTLTEEVLASGEAILSREVSSDERYRNTQAITLGDIHSMMCAPLLLKDRMLGVVYLDVTNRGRPLSETSLRLLSAMAMELSVALENARLYAMLKDSEEFSSSVLKSIAGGVLVVDRSGRILRANETVCELTGLGLNEVLGAALNKLPQLAELDIPVGQTLRSGKAQEMEDLHLYPKESAPLPIGASSATLEDYAGNVTGVVVHFRDLTRLHALTEQVKRAERLSALGQMASGIAHEIRNPLNSVQGFVQLLQESAGGEEHNYCGIILEEVARINHIVQDMLDFSRRQSYSMATVNLWNVAQQVVQSLAPLANERNVRIVSGADTPALTCCSGNRDKLAQVLNNIFRNAVQACESDGQVSWRLALADVPTGDPQQLCLEISDNGCGIPEEDHSRVFDPFYTTRDEGTGLGLSICQKLIELHGGTITMESAVSQGTTFRIYVPALEF